MRRRRFGHDYGPIEVASPDLFADAGGRPERPTEMRFCSFLRHVRCLRAAFLFLRVAPDLALVHPVTFQMAQQ